MFDLNNQPYKKLRTLYHYWKPCTEVKKELSVLKYYKNMLHMYIISILRLKKNFRVSNADLRHELDSALSNFALKRWTMLLIAAYTNAVSRIIS